MKSNISGAADPRVINTISVTVTDLDQIGKMLDLAISNGANEVGGVYFGLSADKEQQAQTAALELAVKDANTKARTIATAMGVTLIGPTSVSIGYYYEPTRMDLAQTPTAGTTIMPGQLQYTVTVQMTYTFN